MALIQQTAAGLNPRLNNPNQQFIIEKSNEEINSFALVVFNCPSSQILKFLGFDVFCYVCSSSVERIIADYRRIIIVCEDKKQQQAQMASFNILLKNIFVFPLHELISSWYARLGNVGSENVKAVLALYFSDVKPLHEVMYHAK